MRLHSSTRRKFFLVKTRPYLYYTKMSVFRLGGTRALSPNMRTWSWGFQKRVLGTSEGRWMYEINWNEGHFVVGGRVRLWFAQRYRAYIGRETFVYWIVDRDLRCCKMDWSRVQGRRDQDSRDQGSFKSFMYNGSYDNMVDNYALCYVIVINGGAGQLVLQS